MGATERTDPPLICPACGSAGPSASRLYRRASWPTWDCGACAVSFVWPLPEAAYLSEVYRFERYASVVYRADSPRMRRRAAMVDALLSKTEATIEHIGSLLDVGCSTGTLMGVASRRGWTVEGLERDLTTADTAARRVGAVVHCAETIGELPADRSYDLIVMSHVLEHVRDPAATLREARVRLRASGNLLIRVPNARSVASRSTGRLWPWFCPPIHLYYFDLGALTHVLDRTGFEVRWSSSWLGDANSTPIEVASAVLRLGVESMRPPPSPTRQSDSAIFVGNGMLRSIRDRLDERLTSVLGDRADSELVVLARASRLG
jgi:SAM-dependent methyltransferase